MDDGSQILWIAILIPLAFAFYFAIAEASFASVSKVRIKAAVERAEGVCEPEGDVSIGEFADLMEWKEYNLAAESAAFGGLTTVLYGDFREVGNRVTIQNAEIKVLEMDALRVERALVTVKELEESEDEPSYDKRTNPPACHF